MFIIKIDTFRGGLADVSATTKTLVFTGMKWTSTWIKTVVYFQSSVQIS